MFLTKLKQKKKLLLKITYLNKFFVFCLKKITKHPHFYKTSKNSFLFLNLKTVFFKKKKIKKTRSNRP